MLGQKCEGTFSGIHLQLKYFQDHIFFLVFLDIKFKVLINITPGNIFDMEHFRCEQLNFGLTDRVSVVSPYLMDQASYNRLNYVHYSLQQVGFSILYKCHVEVLFNVEIN